jgi:prefoldin subunit 5
VSRRIKHTIYSNLKNTLHFEKKKLVLPALIVFILASSVIYGLDLRDNQDLDEEFFEPRLETVTELSLIHTNSEYYPNISGLNTEADRRAASEEVYESTNSDPEVLAKKHILALPAVFAIDNDLIPLTPSTFIYGSTGDNKESLLFSMNDGYVVSNETFEVLLEIQYRQGKLRGLQREINKTNMSYQSFQQRVEQIKSVNYEDEELQEYVFNKENSTEKSSGIASLGPEHSGLKEKLRNNNLKEIRFYHFIPSLVATFLVYYIVSGLVLTGLRDFKSDIEEFSKRDHFFRNNLLLSGFASTTAVLLALTVWWNIVSSVNIVIAFSQLVISSIFWISLFTVSVNELRKFTKHAWIISGVGLNLLIVPITMLAGYEYEFVLDTFILGATPLYPLILGVFSEYGRIHGEKFLRKILSRKQS